MPDTSETPDLIPKYFGHIGRGYLLSHAEQMLRTDEQAEMFRGIA